MSWIKITNTETKQVTYDSRVEAVKETDDEVTLERFQEFIDGLDDASPLKAMAIDLRERAIASTYYEVLERELDRAAGVVRPTKHDR